MSRFEKYGKPSKSQFVQLVTEALRRAGEKGNLHYDREGFAIRSEGDQQRIFWMNNLYKEYCAARPEQRQVLLRNFIRSWTVPEHSVPENFEDVHPDLLPALRARGYFEVTRLQLQAEGHNLAEGPYRTMAEHLAIGLCYDLPGAIVQIGQHNLDAWKVSFDDALTAACENMRGMSKQPFQEKVPGVWMSPYCDNHDASRLVLTEMVRQCEVRGDWVALVPNRDIVLITGSEDAQGLFASASLAKDTLDQPRFLTGIAVRLVGEEWVPFLPPPDHPAYVRLKVLYANTIGRDYANQAEALKAIYEKKNDNTYVSPWTLMRRKDSEEVLSYTVWTDGIEMVLPEADTVYFFRMKGENDGEIVANASWERVRELVGDRMTPEGLYPERYRVTSFPSAEQLAALGRSLPV